MQRHYIVGILRYTRPEGYYIAFEARLDHLRTEARNVFIHCLDIHNFILEQTSLRLECYSVEFGVFYELLDDSLLDDDSPPLKLFPVPNGLNGWTGSAAVSGRGNSSAALTERRTAICSRWFR